MTQLVQCPDCGGIGIDESNDEMPCKSCKGRGLVKESEIRTYENQKNNSIETKKLK